jgi:hypothetical protein
MARALSQSARVAGGRNQMVVFYLLIRALSVRVPLALVQRRI